MAAYVGAPLQSDPKCLDNVTVVFTDNPEQAMKGIVSWAEKYFQRNNHFQSIKRLIAYTSDHAIQGWYFTTHGGARVLNTEIALLPVSLLPIWPKIDQRDNGGDTNGIGAAVLIVDVRENRGHSDRRDRRLLSGFELVSDSIAGPLRSAALYLGSHVIELRRAEKARLR